MKHGKTQKEEPVRATKGERMRAFLDSPKVRPSIQGQAGSQALRAAVLAIVVDFDCDEAEAWGWLQHYNLCKCSPAWSEKELRHALRRAMSHKERYPHKVGSLLRAPLRGGYSSVRPAGGARPGGRVRAASSLGGAQKTRRSQGHRYLGDYPASGRGPSRVGEAWGGGIAPVGDVDLVALGVVKGGGEGAPDGGGYLENGFENPEIGLENPKIGFENPENGFENCEIVLENLEKWVQCRPKAGEKPLSCPELERVFGSKDAFWKVFVREIRVFIAKNGVFPHAVFLPPSVAAELPFLFPPDRPDCLVLPDKMEDSIRFDFIENTLYQKFFKDCLTPGNPKKRESWEAYRATPKPIHASARAHTRVIEK